MFKLIDGAHLITFIIASCIIVIVPGPTVTVIIANSLRYGSRAGLLNVAGTQAGLAIILIIIATGLELMLHQVAFLFNWFKIVGAAYLIWLGLNLYWKSSRTDSEVQLAGGQLSFFWQGFVVIWSNPKALLFLSAFLPQFVNVEGGIIYQTLVLGVVFMIVATIFDSIYAFIAGRAGKWLNSSRVRVVELISGTFLVVAGLWLVIA